MNSRILANVSPCPITGCWWWLGSNRGPDLRPQGRKNGKQTTVARILLAEKLGRPLELWALHTCDQAACVNPDHLYEGTREQNMRDMHDRGRWHPRPLLTHCKNGHPMSGENVLWKGKRNRRRSCKTCVNASQRKAYAMKKAQA